MGSVENSLTLPDARVQDFGRLLREKGYSIFLKKDSMYAFKGMAGRFAPIGVHASMLMIMLGEFRKCIVTELNTGKSWAFV